MKRSKITLRRSSTGWRWRKADRNGHITGASTQGYSRRADALKNLNKETGNEFSIIGTRKWMYEWLV